MKHGTEQEFERARLVAAHWVCEQVIALDPEAWMDRSRMLDRRRAFREHDARNAREGRVSPEERQSRAG